MSVPSTKLRHFNLKIFNKEKQYIDLVNKFCSEIIPYLPNSTILISKNSNGDSRVINLHVILRGDLKNLNKLSKSVEEILYRPAEEIYGIRIGLKVLDYLYNILNHKLKNKISNEGYRIVEFKVMQYRPDSIRTLYQSKNFLSFIIQEIKSYLSNHTRFNDYLELKFGVKNMENTEGIMKIENKVYSMTIDFCDLKGRPLNRNTTLKSLNLRDSLEFMSYIIAIEDEFFIEIPAESFSQFKTLGDIIDYIEDYSKVTDC